jgi:hypothetical protein
MGCGELVCIELFYAIQWPTSKSDTGSPEIKKYFP